MPPSPARSSGADDWATELNRHEQTLLELERKLGGSPAQAPVSPASAADGRVRDLQAMLDKIAVSEQDGGDGPGADGDLISSAV